MHSYVFDARQKGVAHRVADGKLVTALLREVEEAERVASVDIASVFLAQPTAVAFGQLEFNVSVGCHAAVRINGGNVEIDVGVGVVVTVADIDAAKVCAASIVGFKVENQRRIHIPTLFVDVHIFIVEHVGIAGGT